MAKIAVISDIHANIDALNLVLKDIEKRNVDEIVCLGDMVVKYFYPAEVVDAIKANSSTVIKGNCDNLVATNENYRFARSKLGLKRIEYLSELPLKKQITINKTLLNLYHSTPHQIDAMFNPLFNDNKNTNYKDSTINDYNEMFEGNNPQISIVGHTHNDYIGIEKNNDLEIQKSDNVTIAGNQRAIINVGSVGEHSNLELKNGVYVPKIHPYITYLIIDDKGLESGINAEIIKIPYKETLKNVYFDMVNKQNTKQAPYSPNDTKKVEDSLLNMGYTQEDIKKGR